MCLQNLNRKILDINLAMADQAAKWNRLKQMFCFKQTFYFKIIYIHTVITILFYMMMTISSLNNCVYLNYRVLMLHCGDSFKFFYCVRFKNKHNRNKCCNQWDASQFCYEYRTLKTYKIYQTFIIQSLTVDNPNCNKFS